MTQTDADGHSMERLLELVDCDADGTDPLDGLSEEDIRECTAQLLETQDGLFSLIVWLIRGHKVAALWRLCSGHTLLHALLNEEISGTRHAPVDGRPLGEPFSSGETTLAQATRAIAALALALIQHRDGLEVGHTSIDRTPPTPGQLVEAALRHFRDACGSLSSDCPWTADSLSDGDEPLHRCLVNLRNAAGEHPCGASLTAALCLRQLAGRPLNTTAKRSVRVLFEDGNQNGRHAWLRISLLQGGPRGLVPAPERMTVFAGDVRFRRALDLAWSVSRVGRLSGTALWWLDTGEAPIHYVEQGSIGSAFAVVLDEVHRLVRRGAWLRTLLRLQPDTAVIGRLDELGNMQSVGGYKAKLTARGHPARVIVPTVDQLEARDVAPSEVTVVAASTWDEAARAARRRSSGVLTRWALLSTLFALLVAGAVLIRSGTDLADAQGQSKERARIARSRQLVNEATEVEASNPGLARQLLMLAYDVYPTDQARGALMSSTTLPGSFTYEATPVSATARLAFDPRGRTLAVGGSGSVVLHDIDKNVDLANLNGMIGDIGGLDYSPDGRLLAVGDGFGDDGMTYKTGHIQIWNVFDPARPRHLETLKVPGSVSVLRFTSDGQHLFSASAGGPMRFWKIAQPEHLMLERTLAPRHDPADISITPDGKSLAVPSQGGVSLWSADGRQMAALPQTTAAGSVDYAPDGAMLAVAGPKRVEIWNAIDSSHPRKLFAFDGGGADYVHFTPDGKFLVTVSDDTIQLLHITKLDDGKLIADPNFRVTLDHSDKTMAYGVAVARDGRTVAAASRDGTVRIWDISAPRDPGAFSVLTPADLPASPASVNSIAFSPDKSKFAMTCDYSICFWDVRDPARPRELGRLPTDVQDAPFDPAFSRDGSMLFTSTQDDHVTGWDISDPGNPTVAVRFEAGTSGNHTYNFDNSLLVAPVVINPDADNFRSVMELWDLSDPRHPEGPIRLPGETSGVTVDEAAFSPNSRTLAVLGFDKGLSIWDITNREKPMLKADTAGPENSDAGLVFSQDGRWLISSGWQGTGRIWDLVDLSHPKEGPFLAGSLERNSRLTLSIKSHLMGTSADAGGLRIWNAQRPTTPSPMTVIPHADGAIFSPDGLLLAGGGGGGTVVLWTLDIQSIKQRLCRHLGANISKSQWRQYMPGVRFKPPCE